MRGILLYLVTLAVKCALSSPINHTESVISEERFQLDQYRLNDDVLPSEYVISLTPYFEDDGDHKAFTFDGNVAITLEPSKPGVTKISLHVAQIDIVSHFLKKADTSTDIATGEPMYDKNTEILTIPVNETLSEGSKYLLIFNYRGSLGEDMHGFYRSYYNVDGEKVWMASTQFQQTAARRAFPCFDEPKFKARFQVTIVRPAAYDAFSNTRVKNITSENEKRVRVEFEQTPLMSTYLLAFIVADYRVNEKNGIGILARPEAMNQTDYSLEVGIQLLSALETWIGYPYSDVQEMTRMYMAAIPDFSAGAMENWGLLTYRETNILYRDEDSTSLQQQRIAAVISHEIAHQWFGDLVTCEWWDVTWLNEGFARYFQYFGTALVERDWDLQQQFVVEQLQGVMQMDGLESTHPMTHAVYTQAQVNDIFDSISYNKGAVTLRMAEHFLTTQVFQNSLKEYIRAKQYSTVRPQDLFETFNTFGDPSVGNFLEPWTVQSGYPLVTVTGNDNGFTITQKRFLLNNMTHDHEDPTLWPLPITFATNEAEFWNTKPTIVSDQTYNITIKNSKDLPYFILNNQQVGYYRVNYDSESWNKISNALRSANFSGIHVLNRAQIVDDLFNLARAGLVEYNEALDIIDYVQDEIDYVPWLAAINGLNILSRRIHPEDEEMFAGYILQLFNKVYDFIEFKSPSLVERRVLTYLRINVLQWMCNYGHEGCKKTAREEFLKFSSNSSAKVSPDLRQVVYCEGIRQGTEEDFDFLWNQYLTTNIATEGILLLQGLGCAKDRELIFRMMDAISSEDIRPQDKSTAFSYLLANQYTLEHIAEYLRTYYVRWSDAHGSYVSVASAFNNVLTRIKTDQEAMNIRSFAVRNEKVFGVYVFNLIQLSVEDYFTNKAVIEKSRESITKFLSEKTQKTSAGSIKGGFPAAVLGVILCIIATLFS